MMRTMLCGILLAVSALPLAAAGAAEPEVVKFGACLSLSGGFQDYGRINLAGINLFLEDFNSRSDKTGIKLEMLLRDDRSDPAEAAAIVERLALDDGVQVIVGPVASGIMLAMIPKAREHRVVLISPAATSPEIGKKDDWSFKVLFGDDYQGVALAKFFLDHMDVRTAAALVNDHYEYGESIFQAFKKVFEAGGGRIVAVERYEWNLDDDHVPDFTGILAAAKEANPEMVLLPGYAEEAAAIIHQSQSVRFKPVFCGGDAWLNQKIILASGNNLDDSYYVGGADVYADTPAARGFIELFEKSNDPAAEPSSVNGYDVMLLLAEALERGGRTAEQIRDELYSLKKFPLAAGAITFDEEAGTKKSLFIHRISKMGDDFVSEIVAEIEPD